LERKRKRGWWNRRVCPKTTCEWCHPDVREKRKKGKKRRGMIGMMEMEILFKQA
jgi:hypothetical protein